MCIRDRKYTDWCHCVHVCIDNACSNADTHTHTLIARYYVNVDMYSDEIQLSKSILSRPVCIARLTVLVCALLLRFNDSLSPQNTKHSTV